MERYLSRKISMYFTKMLHPAFNLFKTSCFVLFPITIVCPAYLELVIFSISVRSICMLSVESIFVINAGGGGGGGFPDLMMPDAWQSSQ